MEQTIATATSGANGVAEHLAEPTGSGAAPAPAPAPASAGAADPIIPAPVTGALLKRYAWVTMPAAEYPDMEFRVWVNHPTRLMMAVQSEDNDASMAAIKQIVVEHRRTGGGPWLDFDGQPYPPVTDDAFWAEIPTECAGAMIVLIRVTVGALPNSLAPTTRRR